MKKHHLLLLLTLVLFIDSYGITKSVNVETAGTLSSLLTQSEKDSTTIFIVSGNIDARDFIVIRDSLPLLVKLDLRGASIIEYDGQVLSAIGTAIGESVNQANKLPTNALRGCKSWHLDRVMFPNTLLIVGFHALAENYRMTTVDTNQSLTEIDDVAFSNCLSLVNIELPISLQIVRYMAFNFCTSLKSITLHENISYIGDYAFRNVPLIQICMYRLTPPIIAQDIFNGINHSACTLTVPSGSDVLAAYQNALQWKDFTNIVQSPYANNFYNVNISYNSGGTVKYNSSNISSGQDFTMGYFAKMDLTIIPDPGFEVNSIIDLNYQNPYELKSNMIDNIYSFFVNNPSRLVITFKKSQYRLCIKSAENGTTNILCDYGSVYKFDFTPSSGWQIYSILYNGADVTSSLINGIFTTPSISANAALVVNFSSLTTPLSVNQINAIKIYSESNNIIIEGTDRDEIIDVFSISGIKLASIKSKGEKISIKSESNNVYIVKTGRSTVKICI